MAAEKKMLIINYLKKMGLILESNQKEVMMVLGGGILASLLGIYI